MMFEAWRCSKTNTASFNEVLEWRPERVLTYIISFHLFSYLFRIISYYTATQPLICVVYFYLISRDKKEQTWCHCGLEGTSFASSSITCLSRTRPNLALLQLYISKRCSFQLTFSRHWITTWGKGPNVREDILRKSWASNSWTYSCLSYGAFPLENSVKKNEQIRPPNLEICRKEDFVRPQAHQSARRMHADSY